MEGLGGTRSKEGEEKETQKENPVRDTQENGAIETRERIFERRE